jgi:hypothetical protein
LVDARSTNLGVISITGPLVDARSTNLGVISITGPLVDARSTNLGVERSRLRRQLGVKALRGSAASLRPFG